MADKGHDGGRNAEHEHLISWADLKVGPYAFGPYVPAIVPGGDS